MNIDQVAEHQPAKKRRGRKPLGRDSRLIVLCKPDEKETILEMGGSPWARDVLVAECRRLREQEQGQEQVNGRSVDN